MKINVPEAIALIDFEMIAAQMNELKFAGLEFARNRTNLN